MPSTRLALPVVVAASLALAASAGGAVAAPDVVLVDGLLLALLSAIVHGAARAIYGGPAALAAPAGLLAALPVLGAVGGGGLAAAALATAALLVLGRCLLDPTAQRVVLAGVLLAAAALALATDGVSREAALAALGGASLALAAWRALTAERCEPRWRVTQGAATATGLAWLIGGALLAAVSVLPARPSAGDLAAGVAAVVPVAVPDEAVTARAPLLGLNALPLLVLAALRPWRRERRFVDGVLVAGLLAAVLAGAAARGINVAPSGVASVLAAPWLALLAGGAWDHGRAPGARRLATLALAVQAATAVFAWPDYPRAHAPLPPPPLLAAVPGAVEAAR